MISISQSMLKDWLDYQKGLMCGLLFDAKYIKRTVQLPSSAVQRAGQWFEWLCTGAFLRDGSIPPAEYTKTGLKNELIWSDRLAELSQSKFPIHEYDEQASGQLTAMYCKLLAQANRFKEACLHYGITVKETGKTVEQINDEYKLKGVIDVVADFKGECIIDIKSTGLIDDRWSDMGWDLATLPGKLKLMIQPKMYTLLTGLPFYFFVHSNTNEVDFRIIRVEINDDVMNRFRQWLTEEISLIMSYADFGFTAKPTVKQCCYLYKDDDGNYCRCPLYANCSKSKSVPDINIIHLTD